MLSNCTQLNCAFNVYNTQFYCACQCKVKNKLNLIVCYGSIYSVIRRVQECQTINL
nr:MAG TPA: hypothetical protein [Caudoviricetes sp.]